MSTRLSEPPTSSLAARHRIAAPSCHADPHDGTGGPTVVMLVALDERARDECTFLFAALQPRPMIFAHRLGTAVDWMRATRPSVVVIGGAPSSSDLQVLKTIATEIPAKVVLLSECRESGEGLERIWRALDSQT